jgi:PAS domain S-box-containing protein
MISHHNIQDILYLLMQRGGPIIKKRRQASGGNRRMSTRPSYEDLERKVKELAEEGTKCQIAQEELRKSEQRYSLVVENSLTGIYIDQGGKIVFANQRFAEIYGYPLEELIGIASRKLVHPDDRELTDKRRGERLSGAEAPAEYDARGLTKKNEVIWVRRRNTHIQYKGKPAILGNIVDVTGQKRAEEELRKMNEDLKNFVRIVSHDLKNPIIAIQGFVSRLTKKHQSQLAEEGRRYLDQIQASARHMEALVSDLLALSSIGRVEPDLQDVSLPELLREVSLTVEARCENKGIELVVAENLTTVRCDAQRIRQVFENLLVNAIKFTENAKEPRIEIGYRDKGEVHELCVKDNGIGIDPKNHQKIFEAFEQVRNEDHKEGTGLGLPIVKRVVENHGGRVWVESKKGQGATFFFTLPKTPRSASPNGVTK